MNAMPDIRASAEVQQLIGGENLQKLLTTSYSSYRCVRCGEPGRTANPTTVVVYLYRRRKALVELAHAGCAPSEVIELDADPPPGIGLDRTRADMRAMTLVLEYPVEPAVRPLLLLERRTETVKSAQGGEKISLAVSALLRHGLGLMASGSQLPGLAEDWRLHRPDRYSARLLEANGVTVYSGACAQPDDWSQLVDSAGACVVLVGSIGLYAIPDDELTEDGIRQTLAEAASAGMLAGGLVICAHSYVSGLSRAGRPAELSRRIARFWRRSD
jgi:hypothetical protein